MDEKDEISLVLTLKDLERTVKSVKDLAIPNLCKISWLGLRPHATFHPKLHRRLNISSHP